MSERDQRAELVAAILNAIIEARRIPTGEFMIDPEEAVTALAVAAATILEADPSITTPKAMREASEAVARQIRAQMKFTREEFERTGERPWDARPVPVN